MTNIPCSEGAPYLIYKIILPSCKERLQGILQICVQGLQHMGTSTGQNGVGNEKELGIPCESYKVKKIQEGDSV